MMKREIDKVIQELRHFTRDSSMGNTALSAADILCRQDALLRELVKATLNLKRSGGEVMRKFRVWDIQTKQYLSKVDMADYYLTSEGRLLYHRGEGVGFLDVTAMVVVEFSTGLHDAEGKDLDWWEGDKMEYYEGGNNFIIVYDKGYFWFEHIESNQRWTAYELASVAHLRIVRKIGTIHDEKEVT